MFHERQDSTLIETKQNLSNWDSVRTPRHSRFDKTENLNVFIKATFSSSTSSYIFTLIPPELILNPNEQIELS